MVDDDGVDTGMSYPDFDCCRTFGSSDGRDSNRREDTPKGLLIPDANGTDRR